MSYYFRCRSLWIPPRPFVKKTRYTWLETTSLLQGVSQCGVEHMFLEALTRNPAITQHGTPQEHNR